MKLSMVPDTNIANRRGFWASLAFRILLINMLPLLGLAFGLLSLNQYHNRLIESELAQLSAKGEIIAAALLEGAMLSDIEDEVIFLLDPAQQMVKRLANQARIRVRLFGRDGHLIVDSHASKTHAVIVGDLPPQTPGHTESFRWLYDMILSLIPHNEDKPAYREYFLQEAQDYQEVKEALKGDVTTMIRSLSDGGLLLSVGIPVQHYKHVIAALMVATDDAAVQKNLFELRMNIIEVALLALLVTGLLSLYQASSIVGPLDWLSGIVKLVRENKGGRFPLPDLSYRNDEIGDLSRAIKEMTEALWQRMDAIESFAADVAHEIRNPLSSLRSAVETATLIKDDNVKQKLMSIIVDDVQRLDRLISDIAEASRVDAEMSRSFADPVSLRNLLEMLGDSFEFVNQVPDDPSLVMGHESRLAQVFRNLLDNARSFSPSEGKIRIILSHIENWIEIRVEDEGPGIPEDKLTAIFKRFYSERPQNEKFGLHSGLGLSICQQIVESHGGKIWAENYEKGARFVIRLPRA